MADKKQEDIDKEKLADQVKEEWTELRMCTDPVNWTEAEPAIHEAYKCAGYEIPKQILHVTSPLAMLLTRALIEHDAKGKYATVEAAEGLLGRICPTIGKKAQRGVAESAVTALAEFKRVQV